MASVLDHHISITTDVRGGRPHIAGTRITVADLVIMHLRLGQSLEAIAGKYDLKLAAVHAAMAYYYDHRSEVEASITPDELAGQRNICSHPGRTQGEVRSCLTPTSASTPN